MIFFCDSAHFFYQVPRWSLPWFFTVIYLHWRYMYLLVIPVCVSIPFSESALTWVVQYPLVCDYSMRTIEIVQGPLLVVLFRVFFEVVGETLKDNSQILRGTVPGLLCYCGIFVCLRRAMRTHDSIVLAFGEYEPTTTVARRSHSWFL